MLALFCGPVAANRWTASAVACLDRSARTTPGRLPVSPVAHNLADRQVRVLSAQVQLARWGGDLANDTVQIVSVAHCPGGPSGDVPIAVELRRADVPGMNVTRPS